MPRQYRKTWKWYASRAKRIKNKTLKQKYVAQSRQLKKTIKPVKIKEEKTDLRKRKAIEEQIAPKEQKQKAKKQRQRMRKKVQQTRPLIEYIKKEHVATITRDYGQIAENERLVYDSLLQKAMKKPKQFKNLLIDKIESLKPNMEISLEFITLAKGKQMKYGDMTTTGQSLRDVKNALEEQGVTPQQNIDSIKFNGLQQRLRTRRSILLQRGEQKLHNVKLHIRLIRGKI